MSARLFCPVEQTSLLRGTQKTALVAGFLCGAGKGNRTLISNLEGWSNSHYTIPARKLWAYRNKRGYFLQAVHHAVHSGLGFNEKNGGF